MAGAAPLGTSAPPKKSRKWLIIPVVVAALLFGFIAMAALNGPYVRAPLYNFNLAFSTDMDGSNESAAGPGTVTVFGTVTNDGTSAGDPTVFIKIYTGYENESFYASAGMIQPGGAISFTWSHHFDMLDPLSVQAWTTFPH